MPGIPGIVVGVNVYRTDIEVVRQGRPLAVDPPPRGKVTQFSWASRRRLAFVASNTEVEFKTMITLTYPLHFPSDGRKVKRDLNAFLVWLKRDRGRLSYLWFLEFQTRGAPHVHILSSSRWPGGARNARALRFRVSGAWYRIVGSGDPKHLGAGTRTERIWHRDGARRYAVKYAQKMRQKLVPPAYQNVGRFWGASRDVKPVPQGFIHCSEDDVRGVIEEWEHKPAADRWLWRVLYNQAEAFRHHLDPLFDVMPEHVYNRSQSDLVDGIGVE